MKSVQTLKRRFIWENYDEIPGREKNPRFAIAILIKIKIRAIELKINIRLCFAVESDIFLDVILARVIKTIAASMMVECSTVQYLADFIVSPLNCTNGLPK